MPASSSILRIATRESRLALAQTGMVAAALRARDPALVVETIGMTTKGDRILDRPLAEVGGKGLFVKELEGAMLEGRADIAVHSLKDVPMELPEGFALVTFGHREVPFDALVSDRYDSLEMLPQGAIVGTSSLRRECLLRHRFPTLEFRPLRGNVNTRLAKLDAGEYDAIILAAAGLNRLGLENRIRATLETAIAIPAIGQGILGIEFRADRQDLHALLAPLEVPATRAAALAERALGVVVQGSCEVPVGAYARVVDDRIVIDAFLGTPDGKHLVRDHLDAPIAEAGDAGRALGERLLAAGGAAILAMLAGARA